MREALQKYSVIRVSESLKLALAGTIIVVSISFIKPAAKCLSGPSMIIH